MRTLTPVFLFALITLSACRNKDDSGADSDGTVPPDSASAAIDADDDGWPLDQDCDDGDPLVNPDALETCNGVDDDCDGLVDDDDEPVDGQSTWWLDADGDGHGSDAWSELACEQPEGFAVSSDDCNDGDPNSHPDANEACDDADNDCDDVVDENSTDFGTWHTDSDGDGYGDPDSYTESCEGAGDQVADATDCDDDDAAVNPAADESCNGFDDDCDALVDDDDTDLADPETFYGDADGDGFGDPADAIDACEAPSDTVSDGTDCDDADSAVNPDAAEVCNSIDDDCDGLVDDDDPDTVDPTTWYLDLDGDGYGLEAVSLDACEAPSGYVANADDCDDGSAEASPLGTEVCDGLDNDCSGDADGSDAADATTWYTDADSDGSGDPTTGVTACEAPSGTVDNGDDCDDSDPELSPATAWYGDNDGDGYGNPALGVAACEAPSGFVDNGGDCDDSDAAVNPAAPEICSGADDDCDTLIDDDDPSVSSSSAWYIDVDADGYGSPDYTSDACSVPSGYVANDQDCDDAHADANPAGTETCDSLDNDCDGDTDEGVETTWYSDGDGDGHGDPAASLTACSEPSGAVSDSTDCDDTDAGINPSATELCNGDDDDCDSATDEDGAADATTWYADSDGDGYGDPDTTATACSAPSGYVADLSDCDDSDSTLNPDTVWYLDYDGDGYGDTSLTQTACEPSTGFVADTTDCDDLDAAVNPGAAEICSGVDDDCDGLVDGDDPDLPGGSLTTWYDDADGDGYGDPDASQDVCVEPSGAVEDATDCDDTAAAAHPGATEICDGQDNDCDGSADNDEEVLGDAGCPALTCAHLLDRRPTATDGTWSIDPVAAGAYDVDCDMTTEDGGWTLIATLSDDGTDVWSEFMPEQDAGLWDSSDTLGSSITFTEDYKSQAFVELPSTQLLIKEARTNVLVTQEDCWTEQAFVDFISGLSWSADASDADWSDSTGAHLCSFDHFGVTDTVLRAGDHSGAELELGFKWGERDGEQDGNKDRTMITTYNANNYSSPHHVDLPTGLGGFTSYSGSENYEDVNECQGDGPDQCTNGDQDYQLYVR